MHNLFKKSFAILGADKALYKRVLLSVAIICCTSSPALSSDTQNVSPATAVRIYQLDSRYSYRTELLALALRKTEHEYGPASIEGQQGHVTNARGLAMLKSGSVDIASFAHTTQLDKTFHAIKTPLLQGMLGYRIFLIHRDKQENFNRLNTLAQLQEKIAGSGAHWADTPILLANDMPLVTSPKYESFFDLLIKRRIDYFPRGIHEAWKELETYKHRYPSLLIEQSKALFYPFPVYFYINKNNVTLQQRIRAGLQQALADGSMESLFKRHHFVAIQQLKQDQRQVFCLNNPHLNRHHHFQTQWWLGSKDSDQLCAQANSLAF